MYQVMKKKLTLTIEESVKERAKKFARRKGISVSEIVEQYLDKKTRSEAWDIPVNSPVHDFAGALPLSVSDKNKDDDELLREALEEKYGTRSS
jgi:antitoxin component of RelBE/YafQ-DinJ toxin-antitoxin module